MTSALWAAWAARPASHRRLFLDMVRGFAMTARDGVLGRSLVLKGRAIDAAIVERDRDAFACSMEALVALAEGSAPPVVWAGLSGDERAEVVTLIRQSARDFAEAAEEWRELPEKRERYERRARGLSALVTWLGGET